MEEFNAQMSLMKVTINVVSESTLSITIKDADVKKINSNVVTVIVSAELAIVMEKLNAKMDQMKVKNNAASESSVSTTIKSVAATLKLNGPVPTVNASVTTTTVMVNINVLTDRMRTWSNAASISSNITITKSVAATLTVNGLVLMALVSPSKTFAMVKPNAKISLMRRRLIAASKTFHSTTVKSVAVILKLKPHAPMANVSRMIKSVMVLLTV